MTATADSSTTSRQAVDDRAAVDKAISLLACFGADAVSGVGVSELARRADLAAIGRPARSADAGADDLLAVGMPLMASRAALACAVAVGRAALR